MILTLPFLVLVLLVAMLVASASPGHPVRSPVGRGALVGLAACSGTLCLAAASSDFWLVTEAESEVTGRHLVTLSDNVVLAAVLGTLAAVAAVVAGTLLRRSFAGAVVLVAWLLVGFLWLSFVGDDQSSRSSAELHDGPKLLTAALALSTLATVTRWVVARVEARGRVRSEITDPAVDHPTPPGPAGS